MTMTRERGHNPFKYQERYWHPYISPLDPCPPLHVKRYVVPPNQFLGFQPPGLPQFSRGEALYRGTLWPILYSPYHPEGRGEE
jgi:spore coat protein JA